MEPEDAESFEAPTPSIIPSWFAFAAQGAPDLVDITVTAIEMDTTNMFLARLNVEESVGSADDFNIDNDELLTQALANHMECQSYRP
jgi:hypothetical protein